MFQDNFWANSSFCVSLFQFPILSRHPRHWISRWPISQHSFSNLNLSTASELVPIAMSYSKISKSGRFFPKLCLTCVTAKFVKIDKINSVQPHWLQSKSAVISCKMSSSNKRKTKKEIKFAVCSNLANVLETVLIFLTNFAEGRVSVVRRSDVTFL